MSRSVAPRRPARVFALLMLVVVVMSALAPRVYAVEEGGGAPAEEQGPAPGIDEVGTQNEVSDEFRPEPTELPPFQRWLYVPLAIAGFLVVGGLLFAYLTWQPRFAEERRSKRRR